MQNNFKANLDFNDIVFEGRNKDYGAYQLRRLYDSHILKSTLSACFFLALLVFVPKGFNFLMKNEEVQNEEIATVDPKMIEPPPIDPKRPPPPPLPASPPPPKISTVRFVPPEVKPDEEIIEEDPPKQEELKQVQAASETVQGDPAADPNELSIDEASGTGELITGEPEPEADEAFLLVEEMPVFPDGDIQVYFANHLKYPQKAVNKEISGKVYLSFVIQKDGTVSDVTLMKGIGFGLDEEAIRVVSKMPKWLPGKQGGRTVKVKIIQPIAFTL